jgi:hypothetical protein
MLLRQNKMTGFWTSACTKDGKYVGELFDVHPHDICDGPQGCAIHNRPSEHPLKNAPMFLRDDRGILERICEHGVGHPDHDSALYLESIGQILETIHLCDGCCALYG